LGYLLVALLLGAYSLAGRLSPTAGVVAFVLLAVIWPLLWHSALRFRMANTGWRGLRLGFGGTRGQAYRALLPGFALGLVVLVVGAISQVGLADAPKGKPPVLGAATWAAASLPLLMLLALPWLLWLMRRYQHHHYILGAERTQFSAPLKSFYGLGLRAFALSLLALLPMTAVVFGFSFLAGAMGAGKPSPNNQAMVFFYGLAAGLIALAVFQMLVRPYITSRTQNLVWNHTHSQHLRFESQLRLRSLMGLTMKNWLLMIVTLGLYLPFAMVATARLRLGAVTVLSSMDPDALMAQPGQAHDAAAGEAAGDLFGIDIGL
jgi:uncharacterized membrane protein YjgN (DUF898 family)